MPSESKSLEELEVKVAFLEQSLSTLSDEFFCQQKEIDALKQQLALMLEKVRGLSSSGEGNAEILDEKPPHY